MPESSFLLKSSAFKEGEYIPIKYTCDGDDVNPLLEIRNTPQGTLSLALLVDDPDATGGVTWTHWLVWNIDPKTQYIVEDNVPFGAVQGKTSFQKQKYGGPCPPLENQPHHYRFTLYALDCVLDLPHGASKEEFVHAGEGHVIQKTTLTGLYTRTLPLLHGTGSKK
jgi:Raf kinase inhibitor-like YbhB/YbcL family protein